MSHRLYAVLLSFLAVSLAPTTALSQTVSAPSAGERVAPVGPRAEAARFGVAPAEVAAEEPAAAQQRRHMGEPMAMMVVGGAALIAGLIIGGDAGTVLAVGGAIIGLYGLYQYLR
jgi:hypothetical protein